MIITIQTIMMMTIMTQMIRIQIMMTQIIMIIMKMMMIRQEEKEMEMNPRSELEISLMLMEKKRIKMTKDAQMILVIAMIWFHSITEKEILTMDLLKIKVVIIRLQEKK